MTVESPQNAENQNAENLHTPALDPATAWLPYEPSKDHPWTFSLAAHLYRRAAFGGSESELDRAVNEGPERTVQRLVHPEGIASFDQMLGQAANLLGTGDEAARLQTWWLYRMRHSPDPLGEQMVLFFHNHFATSADKVRDAELLLRQNRLFREHWHQPFGRLLAEVAHDPALLIYLDCTENRKRQPNENFAREVMELFALGLDHYTEADIRELARCFTGTEVRRREVRFNPYEHDSGVKSFLGVQGNFNTQQAIEQLLRQTVAAKFLVKKLVRWFVCDAPLDDAMLEPLAQQLRQHDFRIHVPVETILRSRLFYSSLSVGQQVRSPISMVVGWLRGLDASTDFRQVLQPLREMGQSPFYPPNVAGWPGGITWLNSQRTIARCQWIASLAKGTEVKYASGDPTAFANSLGSTAQQRVTRLERLLLATPLSNRFRDALVSEIEQHRGNEQLRCVLESFSMVPQAHIA
jgi:uncharacterized protein (DUF1800 family)